MFNEAVTAADAAKDWSGIQVAVWFVALGTTIGISILWFLMKALLKVPPTLVSIERGLTESRKDVGELKTTIGALLNCSRPTHQCPVKAHRAGTQFRHETPNSLLADAWRAAREPAVKDRLAAMHRELFPGPTVEE